jgi:hypothetical protein
VVEPRDAEPEKHRLEPEVIALRGWRVIALKAISPLLLYFGKRLQLLRARRASARYRVSRHQLRPFEQSVFSQQGEDGILKEIFFRVGAGSRFFVELGVEDGSECNTAFLASCYRWGGVYIEANGSDAARLRERWEGRSDITVRQAFVTAENVATLLAECGVPKELDLLSIDIDGNDYWIWKALSDYQPRVLLIEYNAAYPPPRRWVMAYQPSHHWDKTTYFGASLSSLQDLGSRLGYALLGTDSRGVNAFFLRRDLVSQSGLSEISAEEAYHPPRYGLLALRHPFRSGPFVTGG